MDTMARRTFLGLALSVPLAGCGGGWQLGFGPVRGGSGPTGASALSTLVGRIELPVGLSLAGARVTHLLGEGEVTPEGAFPITVVTGAAQLSLVRDRAGNLMLMGFLREGQPALSTRSTAEALLFLALGLFAHAPRVQARALEQLQSLDLAAIESAIKAAIATHGATWLKTPSTAVGAAVKARVRALQGTGRGMIVTPADRVSGVIVEGDGIGACKITNFFRRRSYLYVTPVSRKSADGVESALPESLTRTEISPTNGTTTLIGTLTDLVVGNDIYQPVSTTVPTPRTPADALWTKYKLYGVGPGVRPGELLNLPPVVAEGWREVFFKSLVFDFVIPFLATVVVPLKADQFEDFAKQLEAGDVLKDLINILVATPGLWAKAREGDFTGACKDALFQILGTDTLQIACLSAFVKVLEAKFGPKYTDPRTGKQGFFDSYIAETWRSIDEVLDLADLAFTTFDTAVQALDIASSRLAETWEVSVTKAKVGLSPQEILVEKSALFSGIKASLVGVEAVEGKVFGYSWKCGKGKLSDGSKYAQVIESTSKDSVAYDAVGVAGGTQDTLTVDVFLKGGGKTDPVGSASARVYVTELTVTPTAKTLKASESVTLTTELKGMRPLKPGEKITYKWLTTRNAGELLNSPDGGPTATYRAHASKEGVDTVTVEAYLGAAKLGTAKASLEVGISKGPYILEAFTVDDNMTLWHNGKVLYNDSDGAYAGSRGPFTLTNAKKGDQIRIQVRDWYGHYAGITDVVLVRPNGTKRLWITGQQIQTPGGNKQIVVDKTTTLD